MSKGRLLDYGGQYAPETMMAALEELETAYEHFSQDPDFQRELTDLLANYAGRPSLLYYAEKMTKDLGGAKIYLKREDLNHTGAHKINNALGQVLLAKKMGKTRVSSWRRKGCCRTLSWPAWAVAATPSVPFTTSSGTLRCGSSAARPQAGATRT